MKFVEKFLIFIFFIFAIFFSTALYFILQENQLQNSQLAFVSNNFVEKSNINTTNNKTENKNIFNAQNKENDFSKKLQNPPEIIRAIYLTSWSSGNDKYINGYLKNIIENTEINSVVIDIKDYTGYISYLSKNQDILNYKTSKNIIYNLENLIKYLHEKNVYVIARMSVFQDPIFAKKRKDLSVYSLKKTLEKEELILWKDNNALEWIDPASEEYQEYIILVAKDALSLGFDEINFDYIRFPSDGDLKDMGFPFWDKKTPRNVVLKNFFKKIREEIPNNKISIDLFGLTTVNYDDLGIGQIIENAFEYFDYVCPMVYPSHYAENFLGFKNPSQYPYDIVKHSLRRAQERLIAYKILIAKTRIKEIISDRTKEKQDWFINFSKIRPWLQDFNLGAIYTEEMVKEQIIATKEVFREEYSGYMLWNPRNIYKVKALEKNFDKIE